MKKVTLGEVKDLVEYEKSREEFRRRIIELKRRRRVSLGDRISLVFENRETVLSQIQEMVRAERIVDPEKVQFEIDTYNELVPGADELSATLFIEITEPTRIRPELDRLVGLNRSGTLYLEFPGGGRCDAAWDPAQGSDERISAVQYVKFGLDPRQAALLRSGEGQVYLVVHHPACSERAPLEGSLREELAGDLSR